ASKRKTHAAHSATESTTTSIATCVDRNTRARVTSLPPNFPAGDTIAAARTFLPTRMCSRTDSSLQGLRMLHRLAHGGLSNPAFPPEHPADEYDRADDTNGEDEGAPVLPGAFHPKD